MHNFRLPAVLVAASVALMGAATAPANAADDSMVTPPDGAIILAKADKTTKPGAKAHTRWTWQWCACGWKASWAKDGIYGAQTEEGVRTFQRMHGLAVDGIAGPKTLAALGLKGRTLTHGAQGDDVKRLQRSLAHHRVWVQVPVKPGTKPTPKPTAKPSAKPTVKPTVAPTPMPTEMPTPMPTMAPTVRPTVKPTPEPTEAPATGAQNRPTLELHAVDWMLPTNAVGAPYTPGMTWGGGGTLWLGDWGIGGDVHMFPNFIAAPTSPAAAANMYDADLKWRSSAGWMSASLGWRGLAGTNYGDIGLRWDLPLIGEWLWLNFGGKGGYNFSNAYMLDGKAGLDLKLGPVVLGGGYRYMWTSVGGGTETYQAPYAGVGLQF